MKMIFNFKPILLIISVLAMNATAGAESMQKNPRVAELEDSLRDQVTSYLRSRFPDQPFLASVSVDPLRRITAKGSETESLPFFDTTNEEMQDEWDNPNISLHELQLRTTRIVLEVALSDTVSDTETAEIKDTLMRNLHMVPARDEIRFETRHWKTTSSTNLLQYLIAFGIAMVFLGGLFLINRQSTRRLTLALKSSSRGGSNSNHSGMPAPMMHPSSRSEVSGESTSIGNVQLSDPIRVREILVKITETLERKSNFPTLKAMVALDEYGVNHTYDLGAILIEFNPELRAKLFSFSTGEWWLQAMVKPATFSMQHLEFLQKLLKEPESNCTTAMEDMLIRVWRLDQKLADFLRTLNKDSGLAVLSHLPKGRAIEAARKAYPGAWADLLDPNFVPKTLSDLECNAIAEKAVFLVPLQNPMAFERHKMEMELRDFLLKASPEEEREIYIASKPGSAIHSQRPPFYPILEESEDELKEFVARFSPEQWAIVLFNVAQADRKKIQKHLNEKQNYMLVETLKRIDQKGNDRNMIGKTREQFGFAFREYHAELAKLVKFEKTESKESENEGSHDEAA